MTWTPCPESTGQHGPADRRGRCPWCGQKYTYAHSRPLKLPEDGPSDLTEAYELFYDPDHGALDPAMIRRRYQTGQTP